MREILPNIFAVEVPKGTTSLSLVPAAIEPYIVQQHVSGWVGEIPLTSGSYEILFTTKDCTEEQAARVVDQQMFLLYRDYSIKDGNWWACKTSTESLQSLLRSHGLSTDKNYLLLRKLTPAISG